MPRTPLIVIGAVGTCLDIAEAALLNGDFEVLGFLDDGFPAGFVTNLGLPVLGRLREAPDFASASFINGIGGPLNFRTRPALFQKMNLNPSRFVSVIHPTAVVSRTSSLGRGCAVLAHCDLSSGAVVGDQVIMLQQTVIGHDAVVGDQVILAAGVKVSGRVRIGAGAYIGGGAVVRQDCRIGPGCLVGAGAVVVTDLPPHTLGYGVPAKVKKTFDPA
jgi:sugar O-acyltransferase (sialic acid O-acetyltransferase NeuD family)